MTMNPTTPRIPNSTIPHWVRFRAIAYLRDRGLSFGIGTDLFPRKAIAPGKYSLCMDIMPNPNLAVCDGRVDLFKDDSFDHVAVGPALGLAPNPEQQLKDLVSKLKMRGHLVLYMPEKNELPGTRFQFTAHALLQLIGAVGAWKLKINITRDGETLLVAKKIPGTKGTIEPITPRGKKTVCICRYGALGDMVLLTPLIRRYAKDGYDITMNITPYAAPLLDNNPYVSNIVFQERDAIPNQDLGPYWDEWRGDYDVYLNLSESIEGRLLKVENRKEFYTSQAWRHRVCGSMNYQDWTMELGGYPNHLGEQGELFFSREEILASRKFRETNKGKFVILWGLNGSSYHKIYPLLEPVAYDFLHRHPDAKMYLVGGAEAEKYQFDHPQVVGCAGKWQLRQTLSLLGMGADLVVGPESMVVNVASCFDVPKIVFLSHSSSDNLTKYWKNCVALEPNTTNAPCYPCHQLHYSLESCPQGVITDASTGNVIAQGPRCAMGAISGPRVLAELDRVYEAWAKQAQPQAVVVS
jgi:ADP-heptose:LPS heptosyltransferase